MKKVLLIAALLFAALGVVQPSTAEARVFVSARFGCCAGGYYPYYPYYGYPAYYPSYAVAPPPVVYEVPPAPDYYAQQPPQQVVVQQPQAAPVAIAPSAAPQASPTFVDSHGRTCRHVQITSTADTICLQPDGSWRTVQ